MRTITLLSTTMLGAMLALLLHTAPAQAQHSWVASNGVDNVTCLRSAPCATFQVAHNNTGSGGEINCVDTGDYGPVTITKSISIVCDNTEASIQTSRGFTINAGPSDTVTLNGLNIDGTGFGVVGILFQSGAALHVNKVKIRNMVNNAGGTAGINFQPNSYAELYVTDSIITGNGGTGSFSGGIVISPGGSGSVNASINGVRLENNSTGMIVDGTRSTGIAVNATVLNTVVAGSQGDGIFVQSSAGSASANLLFDHSVASGNFGSGVRASAGGGSATARIGDSTIVLNNFGVSTAGGGVLQSFKNNRISGNLTDGTPIPAYPGPGGTALQ